MGTHCLNQKKIIKCYFLGTRDGGRFMSVAKLIILFPKPGKLSSCYHLQGMLVPFVSAPSCHAFILQPFMSSRYVLAGWGQRDEPNGEAEWETDSLKGPSLGWEGLKPRRRDCS